MNKLTHNAPNPDLHVFVCINDRTQRNQETGMCMDSCAPEITQHTVRQVKQWIMQNGLTFNVLITKTKCLGVCPKNGGVMVIYGPKNQETQKGIWYNNIQSKDDIINAIKEQLQ